MPARAQAGWLIGWGPTLEVDDATTADDVVAFVRSHPGAERFALFVAPMWPWQRDELLVRLNAAGVETRPFGRSEHKALRRSNRLGPKWLWLWLWLIPAIVFLAGQRLLGRGGKMLAIESIAGAPPTAPPDGGDRAPRPDSPTLLASTVALPEPGRRRAR